VRDKRDLTGQRFGRLVVVALTLSLFRGTVGPMTINIALTAYVLAFMTAHYPVKNFHFLGNSDEYTMTRYKAIAADIADVSLDPDEPSVFRSPKFSELEGRVQTATLIASITFHESQYREDVDTLVTKGDNGNGLCLGQIHLWPGEVVTDRPSCLRAVLRHVRASYRACRSLSGYTVGHCVEHEPLADRRVKTAKDWLAAHPFVMLPEVSSPNDQGAKLEPVSVNQ
jgi:hypothetical protein